MSQFYQYPVIPVTGTITANNASVGPTGTTAPASATEVGGVNAGNLVPVSVDGSGNVNVNIISGGGANASVSTNGTTIPGSSTLAGGKGADGSLHPLLTDNTGVLSVNVLSGGGANASVGATGATAPASATEIGIIVAGNLVGVSSSNPIPVSAASLPLPTGAATSSNQTTANTSLASIVSNQTNGTQTTQISGTVPLPTGAATSALQTTGNTSLSSIDTKTPALGQALAAASVPVVLTAAQISTLTPLASVTAAQGLPTSNANAWPVKLFDTGSSSPNTIKAASTAAVATDTALVVAISPNNTVGIKTGNGTLTDNSGTTSGTPSTSTTLMASNANRKYLFIQNLDAASNIYVNFTSAASNGTGSITILPLASFVQESGFVTTEAVTVLSTAASINYTAKQA